VSVVTVEEVKVWCVAGGIAHAAASRRGHWWLTACGTFGTFDEYAGPLPPPRKCRECVRRLREARPVQKPAAG
jgi:hypothetical protein